MSNPITFWDREEKTFKQEQVYGSQGVQALYGNPLGFFFTEHLFSRPWLSRWMGRYYSSTQSQKKIQPFIDQFQIAMQEYEPGPFQSFNDFFVRKFKPGQRVFDPRPEVLGAFGEGRYLAYESVESEATFPIKGLRTDVPELLDHPDWEKEFLNGPMLICRLCPVDYHRFHFPVNGDLRDIFRRGGKLHSVNPAALRRDPRIFVRNERMITILETQNFGFLAVIEVGALGVGRIIQTHLEDAPVKKGDEKGYFLFGASTVILLGQSGRWVPDSDLLARTREGFETYVKLGQSVGHRA